ncbi:MAG: universal stress protein [Chitinophagaceae bacterium]|jgi:nucleotide-binding universal stress UspA family protein|nr:universal stress protein [Chitinophagaceae bacterium]
MKNILVPVDFSSTAKNSAMYAAALARELGAEKIILYNAYSMPLATEMSWAVLQTEELQKASEEGLKAYKGELEVVCGEGLSVETLSDFGFLAERIDTIAHDVKADLIVMGITGGGKLEEVLMGSNTTHVVHHTTVPVLIVPADAKWKDVEVVGWACDYKDVMKTTPAMAISKVVEELKAKLVVMHNNPDPKAFDPDLFHNNVMVAEMLKKTRPEFDMVSYDNFLEAVQDFVERQKVDMLLVIPKKVGWFESLFRRSHTKMLAFHSHIPLLCLRALSPGNQGA